MQEVTYDNVIRCSNDELLEALGRDYFIPIPIRIDSAQDMLSAGPLLGKITNNYSYLMALYAQVDAQTRVLKKDKTKKDEYSDLVGKRNTISAYIDILKQSYAALSREISVRQAALKEIEMSKSV